MVNIQIKTEKASFADKNGNYTNYSRNMEVSRILRQLADQLAICPDAEWTYVTLWSQHGKPIGNYTTTENLLHSNT